MSITIEMLFCEIIYIYITLIFIIVKILFLSMFFSMTCTKTEKVIFLRFRLFILLMVGLGGLEPPTSRLSGVRSNHLSYKPRSKFSGGDEGT